MHRRLRSAQKQYLRSYRIIKSPLIINENNKNEQKLHKDKKMYGKEVFNKSFAKFYECFLKIEKT